jgi:hypothetical protein
MRVGIDSRGLDATDRWALQEAKDARAIKKLATDGAILAASIVLTDANDYLKPRQVKLLRSILKRANMLLGKKATRP